MPKKPPVAGKVVYAVSRPETKPKAPLVVPEPAAPAPKPEVDKKAPAPEFPKDRSPFIA